MYLCCQAVLAQWAGDLAQAIQQLEQAWRLAEEIGLPGEQWPMLATLGKLYQARDEPVEANQMFRQAAQVVQTLAATIDNEALRAGFLAAEPVRQIFLYL